MRLCRTRTTHTLAFNMTPMIDIVFLLIIFFMTVSQITRIVDQPLQLPRVGEGDSKPQISMVTINLDPEGKLFVGGTRLTMDQAIRSLQSQLTKHSNDPNRIRIQIRADRACESQHVNRLFDQLAQLGFKQLRCAVTD